MPTRTATDDCILVNGGLGGLLLADRLSAGLATTVLLLETGGPADSHNVRIPAAFSMLLESDYDLNDSTAPGGTGQTGTVLVPVESGAGGPWRSHAPLAGPA